MAAKKIVKGSREWKMFQDLWKLCQELWVPEDTDEYWRQVAEKTFEFTKKYDTPFAHYFAVGFLNALDQSWKMANRSVKK